MRVFLFRAHSLSSDSYCIFLMTTNMRSHGSVAPNAILSLVLPVLMTTNDRRVKNPNHSSLAFLRCVYVLQMTVLAFQRRPL